jgi:hypothetical protein
VAPCDPPFSTSPAPFENEHTHGRRLEGGEMCHSTCCNNTASEHAMMLRLMVDDITHWAKDYKVGLWAGGGLGGLPWLWFHGGFSHWHVCRADNNFVIFLGFLIFWAK